MEVNSIRLEKELGSSKAKKPKSGQHRGKDMPMTKKNLEWLKKNSLENSTELIEEKEVFPTQSSKNRESISA